jgi:hypothetical protein
MHFGTPNSIIGYFVIIGNNTVTGTDKIILLFQIIMTFNPFNIGSIYETSSAGIFPL